MSGGAATDRVSVASVVMAGEGAAPSDAPGVAAELGQGEAEAPSELEMLVDAAAGAQGAGRMRRWEDGKMGRWESVEAR